MSTLIVPPQLREGVNNQFNVADGRLFWNIKDQTGSVLSSNVALAKIVHKDDLFYNFPDTSFNADKGLPFTRNVKTLRFQTIFTHEQLLDYGLKTNDVVRYLQFQVKGCPSGTFEKVSIALKKVKSTTLDPIPSDFARALYLDGGMEISDLVYSSNSYRFSNVSCTGMTWIKFQMNKVFDFRSDDGFLLEISTNYPSENAIINNKASGIVMRQLSSSQSLKWHGLLDDNWPFSISYNNAAFRSKYVLDQRVPAIKFCTSETSCPTKLIVQGDLTFDLPSSDYTDVTVGFALNGQQYVDNTPATDNINVLLYPLTGGISRINPPLGPWSGNTEITVRLANGIPASTTNQYNIVMLFYSINSITPTPFNLGSLEKVSKYTTTCTLIAQDTTSSIKCTTPPMVVGTYFARISLNGFDFNEDGVPYQAYELPKIKSVSKTFGSAYGGESVNITGSGFIYLQNQPRLLVCRWGKPCISGEKDCYSYEMNSLSVVLDTEKFVEIYSQATYVSNNKIICKAPSRPPGRWQVYMSNNRQNFELLDNVRVDYTYKTCPRGTEAAKYYQPCTKCHPGFYDNDGERSDRADPGEGDYPIQCEPCEAGKFQETYGADQCVDCPAGTTSLATEENKLTLLIGASNMKRDCTCQNKDFSADGFSSYYKKTSASKGAVQQQQCQWNSGGTSGKGGCCTICPEGALCDGGNASVYANDGYWQDYNRQYYIIEKERIDVFLKCSPAGACKKCDDACHEANKQCSIRIKKKKPLLPGEINIDGKCQNECFCQEGVACYRGKGCSKCGRRVLFKEGQTPVNFYREDGICVQCPEKSPVIYVVSILALVLFLYLFASIAQYFRGLGAPRIFSNYVATSVTFASFNIKWPKAVIDFFNFLRSLNFIDIDMVNPECEVQLDFNDYWLMAMLTPIGLTAVLVLLYVVTAQRKTKEGDAGKKRGP